MRWRRKRNHHQILYSLSPVRERERERGREDGKREREGEREREGGRESNKGNFLSVLYTFTLTVLPPAA